MLTNLTQTTTSGTSEPVIKSFDLPADIRHQIASAFIEKDLNAAMTALDEAEIDVETFTSKEHADFIDGFPTLKEMPIRITSASGLNVHGTADLMIATPDVIGAAEALLSNRSARENLRLAMGDEGAERFRAYLFRDGLARAMGAVGKKAAARDPGRALVGELNSTAGAAILDSINGALASGDPLSGGTLAGALFGGAGRAIWSRMSASKRAQYADAVAKLVTSDDPAVIARVHAKIMSDPELARLTVSAASFGLKDAIRAAPGALVREAPGAVAPVLAAEAVQPDRMTAADRNDLVPAYKGGGEVTMPTDRTVDRLESSSDLYSPRLGVPTATPMIPTLEELLALREVELREPKGGVTIARGASGSVRLRDGGLVEGDPPHGGSAPARTPRRVGANSRRDAVAMGSRARLRPERMRSAPPAPAFDPKTFWTDLQAAIADHASQRGIDIGHMEWPAFDDEPVLVQETVEIATELKPNPAKPKAAPLDPEIRANVAKAKRQAEGRDGDHEPLP